MYFFNCLLSNRLTPAVFIVHFSPQEEAQAAKQEENNIETRTFKITK
jgi:hypothetical protein